MLLACVPADTQPAPTSAPWEAVPWACWPELRGLLIHLGAMPAVPAVGVVLHTFGPMATPTLQLPRHLHLSSPPHTHATCCRGRRRVTATRHSPPLPPPAPPWCSGGTCSGGCGTSWTWRCPPHSTPCRASPTTGSGWVSFFSARRFLCQEGGGDGWGAGTTRPFLSAFCLPCSLFLPSRAFCLFPSSLPPPLRSTALLLLVQEAPSSAPVCPPADPPGQLRARVCSPPSLPPETNPANCCEPRPPGFTSCSFFLPRPLHPCRPTRPTPSCRPTLRRSTGSAWSLSYTRLP